MKTKIFGLSLITAVTLFNSCGRNQNSGSSGGPAQADNTVAAANSSGSIMSSVNQSAPVAFTISFATSDNSPVSQFYVDTTQLSAKNGWSLASKAAKECPRTGAQKTTITSCVLSLAYNPKSTSTSGALTLPFSYVSSAGTAVSSTTPKADYGVVSSQDGFVPPGSNVVSTMVTSPDGKYLAIGSNGVGSGGVRLYVNHGSGFQPLNPGENCTASMTETTKCIDGFLPGNSTTKSVSALAFSADSTLMAIGTNDVVSAPVSVYTLNDEGAFDPKVYIGARPGDMWNDGMFTPAGCFSVGALAFSPDGKYFAVGPLNGVTTSPQPYSARVYSNVDGTGFRAQNKPNSQIEGFNASNSSWQVSALAFSTDSKYLAVGTSQSLSSTVRIFKNLDGSGFLSSNYIQGNFTSKGSSPVSQLVFSPDNNYLAVGSSGQGNVRLYTNSNSGGFSANKFLDGFNAVKDSPVSSVAFSPDSHYLAIGTNDPQVTTSVRLYSNTSGKGFDVSNYEKNVVMTPPGAYPVSALSFPDNKSLAVGTALGTLGARLYSWGSASSNTIPLVPVQNSSLVH